MRKFFVLAALVLSCASGPRGATRPAVEQVVLRHVRAGGPNHRHLLRVAALAPAFARAEAADLEVVQTAALLHDATKEDGAGSPYERLCTHHTQAAQLARRELPSLGFSKTHIEAIAQAIEQHMGPLGENPEFQSPRFMTGFCRRDFPTPSSPEARVLFDLDMLDLMTVDGVVKVVTLRQRNPEFAKESVQASALTGRDSAWKSVVDARQVLMTAAAQGCGDALSRHSRAFLEGIDFAQVSSVEAFEAAAKAYLAEQPLPVCVSPAW
jgi:hypothetical protein